MYQPLNGMAVNCSPPQSKAMLDTAGNAYQRKSNSSNQSYLPKWNWNEDLDQSNEFSPSSLFFRSIEYFLRVNLENVTTFQRPFRSFSIKIFHLTTKECRDIFLPPLSPLSHLSWHFYFCPSFSRNGKKESDENRITLGDGVALRERVPAEERRLPDKTGCQLEGPKVAGRIESRCQPIRVSGTPADRTKEEKKVKDTDNRIRFSRWSKSNTTPTKTSGVKRSL